MNRKIVLCVILVMALTGFQTIFADGHLPYHQFAEGDWELRGERLYQNDIDAGLAKVNIKIPQQGKMKYSFNVRYEGGMRDLHGGFGIHVFADSVYPKKSWGCGESYLLWLNYDADPVSKSIPRGLSAQLYKSVSHSRMQLISSIDLNKYASVIENAGPNTLLPITIIVNGRTGAVRIYNPLNPTSFITFDLDIDKALSGSWIALRTNGIAASFGMAD